MTTVRVLKAERVEAIEQQAITDARLENYNLILVRNNEEEVNLGNVRGEPGPPGTDEVRWKAGAPLSGAAATGGGDAQPARMQAGSVTPSTNTSGDATITFPEAFNGIASVVATIGGTSDAIYTHIAGANYPDQPIGLGNIVITVHSVTLTNFKIRAYMPGGYSPVFGSPLPDAALSLLAIRINWFAFGW